MGDIAQWSTDENTPTIATNCLQGMFAEITQKSAGKIDCTPMGDLTQWSTDENTPTIATNCLQETFAKITQKRVGKIEFAKITIFGVANR
jgi:hypothetical protein